MSDLVTITVDGQMLETPSDVMVIQAASDAGIYIPYLCYHPGMKPYGACRMCVVEVDGAPGTPASCTLPVRDGMIVHTKTEVVQEARKGVNELLLAEHPHGCLTCHRVDLCGPEDICLRHVSVNDRCVTCPKNERCELKDTSRYHEMELNSPLKYQYRNIKIETADPFYDRDYNLCIVCARCVRACDELRGDNAITVTERSGQALVGTSRGTSLLESGCEFCGVCIDVCPVGALVESDYKWEKAVRVERSVCQNCPVGCLMNYEINGKEKVIRAIPELNSPTNRGQACFRGKFGFKYVNHKDRIHQPLIRRDGRLQPASWDEALDLIASRLREFNGDAFAALVHPRNTNEEAYLFQKFSRIVMGSNNVDASSNITPAMVEVPQRMLGHSGSSTAVWDLREAGCILAVGTNVTEDQNIVAVPVKQAVNAGDAKLIVIDPREVELTRYAHFWLRPYPGTDGVLIAGLIKIILEEGLVDQEFLTRHKIDIAEMQSCVDSLRLTEVARITGVPVSEIRNAGRLFGSSASAAVLFGLDNMPQEKQSECVEAIINLVLITGNVGKASAGLYPLPQGANQQGAWDMGCTPQFLPGYISVDDKKSRVSIEKLWKGTLPETPGHGVQSVLEAIVDGTVRGMFIAGQHPNFTNGTLGDVEEVLSKLEFLVVFDSFLTPITKVAEVVLPSVTWAEKEGTYTNLERRIQLLHPLVKRSLGDARAEGEVLCELAQRMGAPGFDFSTSSEVMDEVAAIVSTYGGISHGRLAAESRLFIRPGDEFPLPTQVQYTGQVEQGIQWPCFNSDEKGTSILYADGFSGNFPVIATLDESEPSTITIDDFPFLVIPGRVLADPERDMEVVSTDGMNYIQRDEEIWIHPKDAAESGFQAGDEVNVIISDGRIIIGKIRLHTDDHRGILYVTGLFGELALRLHSSEDPDPMNNVPGLRITPARLAKV